MTVAVPAGAIWLAGILVRLVPDAALTDWLLAATFILGLPVCCLVAQAWELGAFRRGG